MCHIAKAVLVFIEGLSKSCRDLTRPEDIRPRKGLERQVQIEIQIFINISHTDECPTRASN